MIDVKDTLQALDTRERGYSVEIGESVITETKLELVCENDERTLEVTAIIQQNADTGQPNAGWIYVSRLDRALLIGSRA